MLVSLWARMRKSKCFLKTRPCLFLPPLILSLQPLSCLRALLLSFCFDIASSSRWSCSLLCQWGKALGATVIGTVSNQEKAAQAKEDGCHHVIIYKDEDFVAHVNDIMSRNGVDVVYDSVGKDTFELM